MFSHLLSHACLKTPAISRRSVLSSGVAGFLSWAVAQQSRSETKKPAQKPKACILLWMNGGPSHIDTLDPKPNGKEAGTFKAIDTKVKGMQFCEHLPQLAEVADKLAVIRSMTSKEGNHDRGYYLAHTGYAPSATLKHPALGSWISHELGDAKHDLPQFVSIRGASVGGSFLGLEHAPFQVLHPAHGVQNLGMPKNVDSARFQHRTAALQQLQSQFAKATGQPEIQDHNVAYQRAAKLMQSSQVKAFDLSAETQATRTAYGETEFGRGCLMARRLIESGVSCVEVTLDGWDTHYDNFTTVKKLCQELDPAMTQLLRDLQLRDMLDNTLVIWMGEFGRTPQISEREGRDHHPAAWSAMLAGGGVRAGQVYGATDAVGAKVTANPVTIPDFFATVGSLLGIDSRKQFMTPLGRPISLSEEGNVLPGLVNI